VPGIETGGRGNQKRRTRKDLLLAASRLMKQGRQPSIEEIAEEALVSRATVYRYFPSVEDLLLEAGLDLAAPSAEALFGADRSGDLVARVERVDEALHEMILANEAPLRMMLAHALQHGLKGEHGEGGPPRRQNRRTPLIEAALEPGRTQLRPAAMKTLSHALALVVGTEAMLVFKDVLQVDDAEARRVKRWMIRALVDAARGPGAKGRA
jgi:AcrR family transcriptional regulator